MNFNDLPFFISVLLVSYIVTKKFLHRFQNLPPTPFPTLPILGHLTLLRPQNSTYLSLSKLSDKYGPVVGLQLGGRYTLLVSSPSAAEDCLSRNDIIFANRPRFISGKTIGYNYSTMLWAPYGPLWRNHRRIASTEVLSPLRLQLLSSIRAEEVRALIRRLNEAKGGVVEIKATLFETTCNIMTRMIAGKRIYGDGDQESDEAKRFRMMVRELLELGGTACIGDFLPLLRFLGFTKKEKIMEAIFGRVDKAFQVLVDEQRIKMKKGKGKQDSNNQHMFTGESNKCLIEVLLELQKTDPSYFTDDHIKGLAQLLLLAGTESTASTMEWAISLLLNNPHVLNKAQTEVDEQVGNNRLIDETDLNHLPYLNCVINETLRMYPASPLLPPHQSSADCIVGGYHVPRGTMLFVNVWAMQNDPRIWDEPTKFKPERFQNVIKGDHHHKLAHQFIPFGSGRRACPGENLAMRIVALTLGSLIQCYDFDRIGEELEDMEAKVGLSMMKAKPLQANCRPRNNLNNLTF